ncbi:MAG: hypothetical protein ACOX0A_08070 [Thermoguttaceae bacterium]|jgi:hypothetical protein
MDTREKAIVVISGKFLQHFPQLQLLSSLHTEIERSLLERDVSIVRSVVTIASENSSIASNCLAAGFQAEPADDDDLQAAALIIKEATEHSINEVVLAFGGGIPRQFLRLLSGKVRRVLLVNEPIDEGLVRFLDGVYEIQNLPSKEGVELKLVVSPTEGAAASDSNWTQPVDPYDFVKETANEWNKDLEEFILRSDGKCLANPALQDLEKRYRGIGQVFNERRGDFGNLLDDSCVRLAMMDNQSLWFYHPQLIETPSGNNLQRKRPAVKDIVDLIMVADILEEQCRWSAQHARLIANGQSSKEFLTDREELEDRAFPYNIALWPIAYSQLACEDYTAMAGRYELLKKALTLVKQTAEHVPKLEERLIGDILQLAANVLCLIRTALSKLKVPPKDDPIQRVANAQLSAVHVKYESLGPLQNMGIQDTLPLYSQESIQARLDSLTKEYREVADRLKARRERKFEELGNLCEKLERANPEDDVEFNLLLEDLNKVVETVTTLCHDYNEPYTSIRLREPLLNLIDSIPDDLVISKEFAGVCREIDIVRIVQKDKLAEETDFNQVDASAEILAVRRHYPKGSKGIFVGGTLPNRTRDRIAEKLGLQIVSDKRTELIDQFYDSLNDPSVKVFLVYTRWCSSKHARELVAPVKEHGKEHGKDYVRLRPGLSPEQIANSICAQLNIDADEPLVDPFAPPQPLNDDE